MWQHTRKEHLILLYCILLARFIAALWFAHHTPLWEQIDEINHYQYARFIAFEHRLPTATDFPPVPQSLEVFLQFNQPPLYHALLSPAILAFDSDEPLPISPNPPPTCDSPFQQRYIHTSNEHFPYSGIGRAAWVARLITILMGVLATAFIWLTTRILFPNKQRLALLSTALFAFTPAFVELSTWINNDAPLMLFGAISLYFFAHLWQGNQIWYNWFGLFTVGGLCVATKLNGLAILPMIGFVIFHKLVWQSNSQRLLRLLIFTIIIVFLVSGFIGLNLLQCGRMVCRIHRDTFVFNSFDAIKASLTNDNFNDASRLFLRTGTTPWLSDLYPPNPSNIRLFALIFSVGMLGSLLAIATQKAIRGRILILIGIILSAIGLAYLRVWWLQVDYMPVRYTAIAFPAFSILLAIGFTHLTTYLSRWSLLIPLTTFSFFVILIPLTHYAPLITEPHLSTQLPAEANSIQDYHFQSGVQFIGYHQTQLPDQRLKLTLFMTTNSEIDEPIFAMIYALDENQIPTDRCGIIAGGAFWTTIDWQIDEIVAQDFYFESSDEIIFFEVELYYLQNKNHLVNQFDLRRPDPRLSGDLIKLD